MTYQKSTPNYNNADADESSSLFLTVADASPSSSLGHDGVATKKNGVLMVAVVATCFLLGTIYSPFLQKKKKVFRKQQHPSGLRSRGGVHSW